MKGPRFPEAIRNLPAQVPFVGPETLERQNQIRFAARLGANESNFGPSPKAIEAMQSDAQNAWMYGDPTGLELRDALATHLSVHAANIVLGEGIDGLLGTVARLLLEPGDAVVTSHGAYPTFAYHVAAQGGDLHMVPYRDDHEDLDGLATAARASRAKLVYLCNPDNPMGTWHDRPSVEAFIKALPEDCVLVLDEAYCEFAPDEARLPIDVSNPCVIRMRTFSKAYGMAGLRVGYAVGSEDTIRAFEKIRNHFGVGRLVQSAALAALSDQNWLDHVVREVGFAKERIGRLAQRCGLTPLPSATNFVAVDCGSETAAKALLDGLIADRIFVRMPAVAPLNRCIRISAGTKPELDALADVFPGRVDQIGRS